MKKYIGKVKQDSSGFTFIRGTLASDLTFLEQEVTITP